MSAPRHDSPRLVLALLVLGLGAGCRAQRTLTITSNPPGARVLLNETDIGLTPLTHEFYHYGTWRVTASKEGFRTLSERIDVEGPLYASFPFDVVSEALLPVGWEDHHHFHIVLQPSTIAVRLPMLRSVIERAEALRRAGPEGPRNLPPVLLEETTPGEPALPGAVAPPAPSDPGAPPR